ncbi:PHD and RING finger domain-containing 1 isoform X2 [Labeo rohita]|uniref:PHD and RING finger domain-containing 1 isoform X2 n=1 Tax=Labeo rohita TaxID=84645 RepID=A0A498MTF5_LABRO|nr:PHD and RING finger domain-containing 1 isoform X2 [Labeo rohita]
MDEEDSQDELINRNISHGKGKRPAMSIISDDDEDSGKVLEGAVGNAAVDAAALSSDEDSEKCPICLNSFHEQPVATPESCEHYFCLDCILEWSNIAVKKPVKPGEEQVDVDLDQTSCEVCGGRDREDRLLLCDGCDAGYHMECLTPPLDAVPVEEWFCPECIANNRTSGSEQISEEESSSLPTTSRPRSRPTRAIARTQHSERVRANVNRRRITQARTAAQLAPRYMMQSTWLDETINAVVAGLNTAVYVRDLTPRAKPRRRRKTVKRRKTKSKSSSASGGKTTTGVKRRKRKVRRSKSRRKVVAKKETGSRRRIARSLGIKKPKSGSMIPSVYRPSEYSLGSMRAEIGAASLSVYGDPFDLDPFDDREDEIEVPTPSSVLDAKRRGLSRSALRSHQPVARPISAGVSRQGASIPQVGDVAEEAPVSDLLGSILSGQSMLLMDSSDVVINRDGSLKATKPGTNLAGNTGRERTVDQQGTGASQQSRTVDAQRQRADRTGASSSFSSSFTSTTSSFSASSNSRPSSSSVSFRINSSGNPWQARRLPASGGTLPGDDKESVKRNNKSKQMLLSLRAKAKEEKSEVYDPFNPTGSDSSDNEPENEGPDFGVQNTTSRVPIGANEDACHQIKSEPLDVLSDTERDMEMCAEVKTEPESLWDSPCQESPQHSDTMHSQTASGGPALGSTRCEAGMDTGNSGTLGSPFQKAEGHSRSSSSCSEKHVKVEVKSEPETGLSPVRPQSKLLEESLGNLQHVSKGNGMCKELPSVSGALNSSSVAKDKEDRPHQSQSKDRKRSPSNSQSLSSKDSHKKKHSKLKEKRRSRSRSRDRRRSRSKSRERQRSRSRSKERRRPRSRDRRCSSSSSSRERKPSGRRASRERNDNRGRERHRKRSKESRRSRSRSFSRSRSRERRRTSKDQGETRVKRQRSRSTSRERKRREDRSENSRRTERSSHKSIEPVSTELQESSLSANKTTTPVKTERDARPHESETIVVLPSVKQETQSDEIKPYELGSSRHDDPTRTLQESKDDVLRELLKPNEIKQEKPWSTSSVKEFKDIKKDEEVCLKTFGELDDIKEMKKEEMTSLDIFSEDSPQINEIKSGDADLEKSHAGLQDEMKVQEMVVESKKIKIEKIWPDDDDSPSCSDNPLVINLETPDMDAVNCKKEPTESYQSPPLAEDMEMSPLQQPEPPIKQEPDVSSDEDISVDYLIDNLDFIKKEMSESSVADSTEAVDPKSVVPETPAANKQTTETVTPGVKSKSQGKRVTWNLQEPEEPQSEKLSKLALFKLKLKQEGSRRSATNQQNQAEPKTNLPPQDESSKPKSCKESLHDSNQKEKYMKKLHMQERAIEEVKLAIKPFYQKRDITKEEYKEILRKAVQKVCHSKSGEINPVKVANLVKAYVDKYKHARKHKKEETGQSQQADV